MTNAIVKWKPQLNNIYHMDALTLLGQLDDASIDVIITDPPYGLANQSAFVFPDKRYSAVREIWDHNAPTDWMKECKRVLTPHGSVICFGVRQSIYDFANMGLSLGWRIINDITWVKPDAPPNFTGRMMTETTERILWFSPSGKKWTYNKKEAWRVNEGKNFRDVWVFPTERNGRVHPTQKPVQLIERVVSLLSYEGDTILDPFIGSGTTAIAARNLNRNYIGCDITPEYVQIARDRLQRTDPFQPTRLNDEWTQPSLFGETA